MAGPDGPVMPGQEVTVDNETGISLVKGGYAELVERGPDRTEMAVIEPQENTDARPQKAKPRGRK